MKMPRILTIAGSDSGGGAGIQADLKAVTALGGYGMTVITALTAQNTLGVQGIHEVPVDFVEKQFDSVAGDIGIDAAKTGMLATSDIIACIARKIREYDVRKVIVDPVMVAKGGAHLIREDAKKALVDHLVPLAYLITPNIPEAEVLAGFAVRDRDDMKKAALAIRELGAKNVLVKGGHLAGEAVDILYDGEKFYEIAAERIETQDTHGTGCTYSAAIATLLAREEGIYPVVRKAKEYISAAIRFSLRLGGGHGPTNPCAQLFREVDRYRCLQELKQAVAMLEQGRCGNIVPEVQTNFGYALPYALQVGEVAAFPGRIIRVREEARTFYAPEFGASSHIARIILTVMKYDAEYRSVMNIRFSEAVIRICRELGYDIDHFSRAEEPEDVQKREGSTLEWGTNFVLSRRSTIPDIIFDRGGIGKEPMVRIIGRTPLQIAERALSISKKLRD